MGEQLAPKSNFLMKVTVLKKSDNDDNGYKVINSNWFKSNRRDFLDSLQQDRNNGIKHEIEVVYKEPDKFKINQIYMLADREKIWVFVEDDESNDEND